MTAELPALLRVAPVGEHLYEGKPEYEGEIVRNVVFGGQILAQMIMAAHLDRGDDKEVKSIHAIFARAGDYTQPIQYLVERMHDGRALTVEKTISIDHARLTCSYRLTAPGAPFSVFFAPELNLTLLAGDAPDRYYRAARELSKDERKLASRGESEGPLELVNEWDRFLIRVRATPAGTTWRYPLETASQSEGGFERTYQGSVLLPIWPQVALGDGKWFEAALTIELESF